MTFGIRLHHRVVESNGIGGRAESTCTDVVYQLEGHGHGEGLTLAMNVVRDHTGGVTSDHGDNQPQGGEVVIIQPSELQALKLDVYSDHSIIEAFAQGGRAAVTSRIYPDTGLRSDGRLAPWSASLIAASTSACIFAEGAGVSATAQAFELGTCWVDA